MRLSFADERPMSLVPLERRPAVIAAVADMANLQVSDVAAASVRTHWLFAPALQGSERRVPRWVVPLRYGRPAVGSGSAACSMCLRTGEVVYFRSAWRLSMFLACPVHGVLLIDRCQGCGYPLWPYAAASRTTLFTRFMQLDECPRCHALAREAAHLIKGGDSLVDCARLMQVKPGGEVFERIQAFRALVNLAIHTKSRRKLAGLPEFEPSLRALGGLHALHASFDRLSLAQRAELVDFFWPLLARWPSSFLEMAHRAGIRLVDFSSMLDELPQAMLSVVEVHLGRPSRAITEAAVESAVRRLTLDGQKINRESVGRLVGSRFSPLLNHLRPREAASEDERELLVQGLDRYVRSCSSKRKSTKMIRCRNALIVCIAISMRCSLQEALNVSWPEARMKTGQPLGDESLLSLRQLQGTLLGTYLDSMRTDEFNYGPLFVPFRGRGGGVRGPTQALRAAMDGLDERLRRTVAVFWSNPDTIGGPAL